MISKSASTPFSPQYSVASTASYDADVGESGKAFSHLYKFNGEVVYELLSMPVVPFALNYLDVVGSLSELLCELYRTFLHDDCYRY
jgi:hypothetical protein